MSVLGGDLLTVSIEHPLHTMELKIKSNSDNDIKLGGSMIEDDENLVTTQRELIKIIRIYAGTQTFSIVTDNRDSTLTKLNDIAQSYDDATFTTTNVAGVSYTGVGAIVGDVSLQGSSATIDLTLRVPMWEQIV